MIVTAVKSWISLCSQMELVREIKQVDKICCCVQLTGTYLKNYSKKTLYIFSIMQTLSEVHLKINDKQVQLKPKILMTNWHNNPG